MPQGATVISLDGGACLGTCSDFGIHLLNDGTVYFEGRSHTLVRGVVTLRVRSANYRRLRRYLEEHHAFDMGDDGDCLTDSPAFYLTMVDSTGKRTAYLDTGCVRQTDRIWEIVAEIIRLTDTDGMIR